MEKKNIILTGDRPTGRLHLGHYVGSLKRRVELQNSGQFDEINILIADDQALTDNADNPRKIRDNIVNVVFTYLDAFCTDEHFASFLPDYRNLDEMKEHYRRGGLGDGTCKKFLINVLETTLEPIRAARAQWEAGIDSVYDIVKDGTQRAVERTNATLARVRKAMKIDYFEDRAIVQEWNDLLRQAKQ